MNFNPYDFIIIQPGFIPQPIIKTLLSLTNQSTSHAEVGHSGVQKVSDYRSTEWVPLPPNILDNLKGTIYNIHETIFKEKYKTDLVNIENPQFLKYGNGGKYDVHNDCEDWVEGKIKKIAPRDISVIFYLNNQYEGGELEFTNLGLTIKPATGMMIAFPSYFEYSHRVHPVTEGVRYNIVSWIETKNKIYERN